MGYFTTQLLYNYSLKSSSEDHKLEILHLLTCLAFLVIL